MNELTGILQTLDLADARVTHSTVADLLSVAMETRKDLDLGELELLKNLLSRVDDCSPPFTSLDETERKLLHHTLGWVIGKIEENRLRADYLAVEIKTFEQIRGDVATAISEVRKAAAKTLLVSR